MELKRTPLYEVHEGLGARLVDFAGFVMPVQYSGVLDEHRAVRSACGLFDVSHMGEVSVGGEGALEAVQRVTTNDASLLPEGRCQYTLICNPRGGVIDDTILYRLSPGEYLFCVNASNTGKAFSWIRENAGGAEVVDRSSEYAQIAVQGPRSAEVLASICREAARELAPFRFLAGEVAGARALISRTGYTGEDGFELYLPPASAPGVWEALTEAGAPAGVLPCGLGARDLLRLEMGYPLYGHELDEDTTPLEAGLARFVALGKGDFIGADVLREQAGGGVARTLVGLEMEEAGIPRRGYPIIADGEPVGEVTSGTRSPALAKSIGMGYVPPRLGKAGTEVEVEIRNTSRTARVVRTPFYRRRRTSP